MRNFEITRMTAADVADVAALEAVCFSDPWSEASVASELDNPLSLWLVARDAAGLLGYAGSQSVPDESDMMNLAVRPDARRQGVAQALLQALEAALRENGIHSLTLEVRAGNAPAIRLYTQAGFRQVGLRKNYYFHPKEDALILKKEWEL